MRPYDSGKRGEVTDVDVSVRLRALFDEDDVEVDLPVLFQYCDVAKGKVYTIYFRNGANRFEVDLFVV